MSSPTEQEKQRAVQAKHSLINLMNMVRKTGKSE